MSFPTGRARESSRFFVCPDCGRQFPTSEPNHSCDEQGQRLAAELLDELIDPAFSDVDGSLNSGIGLCWLYRIAYRIRSRMNGLGKYKDRAEMGRRICQLAREFRK